MFTARTADRNRGWALYCSKSCKAKEQEKRTGQYAAFKQRSEGDFYDGDMDFNGGWDEHKDWRF
jgi:hypothetical protein